MSFLHSKRRHNKINTWTDNVCFYVISLFHMRVWLKNLSSSRWLFLISECLSSACECLKLNILDRYSLSQEVQLEPFRRGETYQDKSPMNSWLNTKTPMFCSKLAQESIKIFHWTWRFVYGYTACFTNPGHKLVHYLLFPDAPTFLSNQTMYYSWEGNPINISCEVLANPSASVQWKRGKLVLPVKNATHLKTYSTGRKLILEVRLHMEDFTSLWWQNII